MKPIINIEFTGELPFDECQKFYDEVRNMSKDEGYCVI